MNTAGMIAAALPLAHTGWGEHMGNWGAGWWILMALFMVAFWALVIVGIVWLVRSLAGGRHDQREGSAIELLDRRFAAGEISSEEYRERRAVLRGEPGAAEGAGGAEGG